MSTLCALILTCLLIALVILLYVDNYPWDIHVTSWKQMLKLNHPLCCFNAFYFESIALWVNSYAKLFDACLESTIHEKFLLIWFSCLLFIYLLANYRPLLWVTSFMTWALQYHLIKIVWKHVSSEIICCYRFTYSRTSRTKLGDAWYVSNVSIISAVPCLYYTICYMFYIYFISLLCIFWD